MALASNAKSYIAPAKINLTLHITGKRADGYHELDSIVAFSDFGDEISFEPSSNFGLSVTGQFAEAVDPSFNSVRDAVAWFEVRTGKRVNHHIHLEKRLPVGAGLGGGTSDCATTIHALCALYEADLPKPDELSSLGADVPVCFYGQTCRMAGIGEVIEPCALDRDVFVLLVNPMKPVTTRDVFTSPLLEFSNPEKNVDLWEELQHGQNDMTKAAVAQCPEIKDILETLSQTSASITRMSGSGASVFALFEQREEMEAACKSYARPHSEHWVMGTKLKRAD